MNCSYCTLSTNLVKCLECGKHFCNTRTTSSVSHIIFHLVKSRHKRIEIKTPIVCSNCSESNIFLLGTDNKSISCRKCGTKEWTSLIEERCLVSWLTDNDESSESGIPVNLTKQQMMALEENHLPQLPLTKRKYTPEEHIRILSALINAEAEQERSIKESLTRYNISIRWQNDFNTCLFAMNRDDTVGRINTGDEVKITGPGYVAKGYVCNDSAYTEDVIIEVMMLKGTPRTIADKIEFIWKNIGYERMEWALHRLKKTCSRKLYNFILTGEGSLSKEKSMKVLQPENMPVLNESQEIAVKAALSKKLTLIQGPPGTGKTVTCAAIVYNLVKQGKGRVLVVAPSNTAVDNLTKQINKTGVKVVRVMSKSREWSDTSSLALHVIAQKSQEDEQIEIKRNTKQETTQDKSLVDLLLNKNSGIMALSEDALNKKKKKIIGEADVITCTCITAGQHLFHGIKFPNVLIDEAVQSTEPMTVIPLTRGCRKLVMVGDHKQLGPTILDKRTEKAGLKISLFERLVSLGVHPYLLTIQYRMHPLLSEWPSNMFYQGNLMNGTTAVNRTSVLKSPTFFYACYGKEEVSSSGTSFLNQLETDCTVQLVSYLQSKGVKSSNIGIITPYEGQRVNISRKLKSTLGDNIMIDVANVDAFQGREKDYIIVSVVRSNEYQGIGFVSDKRRLNVALTRAKYGLVIIGNPLTLMKNEIWKNLISFYQQRDLIYEGNFYDLKKCLIIENKKKIFDLKALADLL